MAKFEGNYPKKTPDVPNWFGTFLENYYFVIKYLTQTGKAGNSFTDSTISYSSKWRVTHGQVLKIAHDLGFAPSSVQIQGGRVEWYEVQQSGNYLTTVKVNLLRTLITDTTAYANTVLVGVLSPDLFKVGDSVLINSQARTVTEIVGSSLRLDASVSTVLPGTVILNSETVNLVIF